MNSRTYAAGLQDERPYRWMAMPRPSTIGPTDLIRRSTQVREDLAEMAPWLELLPVPERFSGLAVADRIPSLAFIKELYGLLGPVIDRYEQEAAQLVADAPALRYFGRV